LTLNDITSIISIIGIIVSVGVVIWVSSNNAKMHKERNIFEKKLLDVQNKQNEKIIKMQTELENVNKKLELEQQFILEKKKHLFESKIDLIDDICKKIGYLVSNMPSYIELSKKGFNIDPFIVPEMRQELNRLSELAGKAISTMNDADFLLKFNDVMMPCGKIVNDCNNKIAIDEIRIAQIDSATIGLLNWLGQERIRLCNEGLDA
jgi:hypothetical protein